MIVKGLSDEWMVFDPVIRVVITFGYGLWAKISKSYLDVWVAKRTESRKRKQGEAGCACIKALSSIRRQILAFGRPEVRIWGRWCSHRIRLENAERKSGEGFS